MNVRKVAVLGAGVMGAQIAAHFVNAGFQTLLFDLADEKGTSAPIHNAVQKLKKLKPAPFALPEYAGLLQAANYETDLESLKGCDLVIEAISERLDWKQALFQKVSPFLHPEAILATNSSGLSIESMADSLPASLKPRFCGVHFFNPPRYMRLVELIPHTQTQTEVLSALENFLVSKLGKGVVRAKDTPNFIANRIGVFAFLATLHHAQALKLSPEVTDALTGPLLGRAKSATYRTLDVVGLDVMSHVVDTLKNKATQDPWADYFTLPSWMLDLIQSGALGQKTKKGIYQKQGKTLTVYDPETKAYRPVEAVSDMPLLATLKKMTLAERLSYCQSQDTPEAQFIWRIHRDLFHYCAFHLGQIADNVRDIDWAMRWGFGWSQGPFEIWQAMGWTGTAQMLDKSIQQEMTLSKSALPKWISEVSAVYRESGAYAPTRKTYEPRPKLSAYQSQVAPEHLMGESVALGKTIQENGVGRLWTFDNETLIYSWKTPRNCIGSEVLEGILSAIDCAEKTAKALVLYPDQSPDFSVGANLKQVAQVLHVKAYERFEQAVTLFQKTSMRLRCASVPCVAAVRGLVLGGGCEIAMHCAKVVAHHETYMGLVESGVGLIPAAGGTTAMAREISQCLTKAEKLAKLQQRFQQLAMAQASTSASEAVQKGYLRDSDNIIMQTEDLLFAAIQQASALASSGYRPPRAMPFAVMGKTGKAALQTMIINMAEGHFITPHDIAVAEKLAHVICGGDLDEGTLVDERWMLHLEKEAFLALGQSSKTQARIQHTLQYGKPLRN